MNIEQQITDFQKMTTDLNRWSWVFDVNRSQIENCEDSTLTIIIDNDQTHLMIGDNWFPFAESIGNSPGIFDLLLSQRISCELV